MEKILNTLERHQKIVKYIISGGTAAVVNFSLLYIFADILGFWYLSSSMVAFILSIGVSFSLQKLWTFQDARTDGLSKQATLFFFIQIVNLGLNTLIVYTLVEFAGLWHMVAQIIAGATLAVSSFIIFSKFLFQREVFKKEKLCFILPNYNVNEYTHFVYLYDLIRKISKDLDIFLIIERGNKPIDCLGATKCFVSKFSIWPLKIIEIKIAILRARLLGYKTFYVHYSFFSALFASITVKIFGGKVLYWNCGMPWKYKRGYSREYFERMVYKSIDYLVTGTKTMKSLYSQNYSIPESKILILPNWIDITSFKKQLDLIDKEEVKKSLDITPDKKIVLFVHHLSERKGAHYLPQIIRETVGNALFLIVGDGPYKAKLCNFVATEELNDRVKILGKLPQNQLAKLYAIADLFIMPSEEEGFPHVLLEAMVAGVPFVAFNVGGVRDIVPLNATFQVVSLGDVDGFIKTTNLLLFGDGYNLSSIRDTEFDHVKKYDIQIVSEKFIELLKLPM